MKILVILSIICLYVVCVIDRIITIPFTNIKQFTLKEVSSKTHIAEQVYYRVFAVVMIVGFAKLIIYLISLI